MHDCSGRRDTGGGRLRSSKVAVEQGAQMTLPEQQRAESEQEGARGEQEGAGREQERAEREAWAFSGGAGRREVGPKGVTWEITIGDRVPLYHSLSLYSWPISLPRRDPTGIIFMRGT